MNKEYLCKIEKIYYTDIMKQYTSYAQKDGRLNGKGK